MLAPVSTTNWICWFISLGVTLNNDRPETTRTPACISSFKMVMNPEVSLEQSNLESSGKSQGNLEFFWHDWVILVLSLEELLSWSCLTLVFMKWVYTLGFMLMLEYFKDKGVLMLTRCFSINGSNSSLSLPRLVK